jgi:hypothetical protein
MYAAKIEGEELLIESRPRVSTCYMSITTLTPVVHIVKMRSSLNDR